MQQDYSAAVDQLSCMIHMRVHVMLLILDKAIAESLQLSDTVCRAYHETCLEECHNKHVPEPQGLSSSSRGLRKSIVSLDPWIKIVRARQQVWSRPRTSA